MKRIVSVIIALIMVLSLAATAFAAQTNDGVITISNAIPGETYDIYRIFDLESFSGTNYAYRLSAKWERFAAEEYFTINHDGYVEWKKFDEAGNPIGADEVVKLALAYAKTEGSEIAPDYSKVAETATLVFDNLPLGYYLVDTSLGALCSLDTTDKTVEILEKNEEPPVEKVVEEDSTGVYGGSNTADLGQVVNFKSTITVKKGTENYVLHDVMDDNLTFNKDIAITVDGVAVHAENYTITYDVNHMKPGENEGDPEVIDFTCDFEIAFKNKYILGLDADTEIVVTYTGTVIGGAPVYTGIPNETKLTYGNASDSEWSETVTKVYGFEVFKFYKEAEAEKPLNGAKFIVYKTSDDTVNGTKEYAMFDENNRLIGWTANEGEATELVSGENGYFQVLGLDADTYFVKETEAPAGYNLLVDVAVVTIDEEGKVNGVAVTANEDGTVNLVDIKIENKAGIRLPSTGGIGTTIFYVLGGVLMVGAAVLLIAKRRMNNN